jgi:hypothetical protein
LDGFLNLFATPEALDKITADITALLCYLRDTGVLRWQYRSNKWCLIEPGRRC